MYKKKILLLSFTIYFIFSMSGCQALNSSIINLEKVKVAYVINKGCLEDKGLNELGLEGVNKAATELGVKITTIEIDKSNEQNFQKEFIKATKSNDLIIVVGDDFNNVVNEAATNYRDKKFIVTSN
ncbi:BMP family ABC transporter substrate-binding protein, partial [Clostridium perfringens]|uniref:BMP family ABC transporter substrate-binding protein n=2 Tax=Clostridium TaxID=1485 RepID=UPI002ACF0639